MIAVNGISQRQKLISSVLKVIVFLSAVIGTFLSWYAGKGSFMGCVWWILALLTALIIVGYLYLAAIDALKAKLRK